MSAITDAKVVFNAGSPGVVPRKAFDIRHSHDDFSTDWNTFSSTSLQTAEQRVDGLLRDLYAFADQKEREYDRDAQDLLTEAINRDFRVLATLYQNAPTNVATGYGPFGFGSDHLRIVKLVQKTFKQVAQERWLSDEQRRLAESLVPELKPSEPPPAPGGRHSAAPAPRPYVGLDPAPPVPRGSAASAPRPSTAPPPPRGWR